MSETLDRRRIAIYLAFAFGLAWLTGLAIFLRGGLAGSRELIPGTGVTEAFVLLATGYMTAPAVAHILTRLITREGWKDTWLRPQFRRGWRYWVAAWLGTFGLILGGAVVYFLLFPQHFDSGLSSIAELIASIEANTGQPVPLSPAVLLAVQILQALFLAPVINALPVLGEEFGWRAYLQPKLLPLGGRQAMVWMGIIWGVWHWPIILMGHNYGLDYPGAPWLGPLTMVWFTLVVGTFFGWVTLRAGSVWPAVIGHGVLNGLAPGVLLLQTGEPNQILGPLVAGWVGGLSFAVVAGWLLWRGRLQPQPEVEAAAPA